MPRGGTLRAVASSGLRTIATYGDRLELELARARLRAANIRVFVADEHTSTLNPHYMAAIGGLKLSVHEEDAELALEILNEPPEDAEDDEDEDDGPACPRCGARYAYFEHPRFFIFFALFLLGLPLLFCKKRWHCKKCDETFAAPPPNRAPGGPYRTPRRAHRT